MLCLTITHGVHIAMYATSSRVRAILITKADAGIATPDPGSLELVAAYNYSTFD